jgi:hypothetical protein
MELVHIISIGYYLSQLIVYIHSNIYKYSN